MRNIRTLRRRRSLAAVRRGISLRQRLLAIGIIAAFAFGAVAVVNVLAARHVSELVAQERATVALQESYRHGHLLVSRTRNRVLELTLAAGRGDAAGRAETLEEFMTVSRQLDVWRMTSYRSTPPGPLLSAAQAMQEAEAEFMRHAEDIVHGAAAGAPPVNEADLEQLDDDAELVHLRLEQLLSNIESNSRASAEATSQATAEASRAVVGAALGGVGGLLALLWLAASSILNGLARVSSAARDLADGDLRARVPEDRGDEIGALGAAFNATAMSFQAMMCRLEQQTARDAFGRQLGHALEMADTEQDAYGVVARAFSSATMENPTELLMADSSRANLELRAEHPDAGAPACTVESPYGCVAVRRGTATTFADSASIDACPRLHDRPDGPCSAVCIPVTFLGRAIGVLHTTGPAGRPPDAEVVDRLSTVAAAAGSRIGTVRTFEQTQLQAQTDGLTGLMNRRTFESAARQLLKDGVGFSLVMADLDHFKKINDTFGHETGDRALVLFAEQLRSSLRTEDLFARYGGEEFILLLRETTTDEAVNVLNRFLVRLSEATTLQPPLFTCSFGVAYSSSEDKLPGLIRRADAALYRAKELGRNRAVIDDKPADIAVAIRRTEIVRPREATSPMALSRTHQALPPSTW